MGNIEERKVDYWQYDLFRHQMNVGDFWNGSFFVTSFETHFFKALKIDRHFVNERLIIQPLFQCLKV